MIKTLRAAGGGKLGGDSGGTPTEEEDTLKSTAYARVLDVISEGPIVGLVNGLQSVFLDETPLMNPDGSYNFKEVQVDFREGTWDQTVIPNFPGVESETAVGILVEYDSPYTHAFTNLELTTVRIRLAVAALTEADTETGDITGYRVEYAIDLAVDGGLFSEIITDAIDGKTTSQYERSHIITLPPASVTGWIIRVRRLTEDTDSLAIQDDFSVVSYTEIIDVNLRYPMTALAGTVVNATQFRSIPTRAFECYGRIIMVPSNYDPETATYTGIWDGTFQPLWSDNPAWCYYDMLLNDRYGLGHLLVPYYIDKWTLYTIAQYCDGLVSDGKGGTERRFTCNLYLQVAAEAYKVIQDMASIFRGIAFWANSTVMCSADMPGDPVYVYNNANVIDGRFTYSGTARKTRHTMALIGWSDPADFYRGKIEPVADDDGIARYGVQVLKATALGCTSQGMAHRYGRWMLFCERLLTDTVSFDVGLDGTIAAPGQFIQIADSYRAGARIGGRVKEATTTVITPDVLPPSALPGDTLTVILPSGVSQQRAIASIAAGAFTVAPAYDDVPLTDSIWGVSSAALAMQDYKVISVAEAPDDSEEMTFSIVALQSNQSIFDAVDFGFAIQVQDTSALPSKTIAPPAVVTVTSYEVVVAGVPSTTISVNWSQVTDAVEYEVQIKREGGNWSALVRTGALGYDFPNSLGGEYIAQVRAISATGVYSLFKRSDAATITPAPTLELMIDEDTGEVIVDEDTGTPLYSEVA